VSSIDQKAVASPAAAERVPPMAWASLGSACLGWMFDAMDLQLFTVILFPSVSELIGTSAPAAVAYAGGLIMACKLLAWGLGGIVFGVVADRLGRSRTMALTVLIYSVFTGLSALSQNWWELALFQALAGIGIGGEWAAGSALVAETWPERSRQRALQVMQMSFAFGFFLAGSIAVAVSSHGWRWVLVAGVAPAAITIVIRRFIPEPERWHKARDQRRDEAARRGKRDTALATFLAIFAPGLRRRTIVGVLIAATVMIAALSTTSLLAIWFHQLLPPDQLPRQGVIMGQAFMLMNIGSVCCYLSLIWLMDWLGRRWSYALVCVGGFATILFMFTSITTIGGALWFMPVYGFFLIGGFGSFASYLPELFPTRVRATGQGFCWNMARALTAAGPYVGGVLVGATGAVTKAGLIISTVYIVGLVAIWFGPETKGQPLPD
jgi:MFS family permease